jgi:hypothetical protein
MSMYPYMPRTPEVQLQFFVVRDLWPYRIASLPGTLPEGMVTCSAPSKGNPAWASPSHR